MSNTKMSPAQLGDIYLHAAAVVDQLERRLGTREVGWTVLLEGLRAMQADPEAIAYLEEIASGD